MKISLDTNERSELDSLIEIFNDVLINGEEVSCFNLIKKMVENDVEIDPIQRKKMLDQLKGCFDWLDSLNVKISCKEKLIACFSKEIESK